MLTNARTRHARRKHVFECLDDRYMMAGDVGAYVQGGTLHINGDAAANWVEISEVSPGHVRVADRGLGTRINGRTFVDFTAVTSIDVRLGGEYDAFYVKSISSPFVNVSIDMGAGGDPRNWRSDEVHLGTLNIKGDLTVSAQDKLNFDSLGNPLNVRGATRITGGLGNNHIQLVGAFNSVAVATFAGNDTVLFGPDYAGRPFNAKTVDVRTGAGNDRLSLSRGVVSDRLFADLGAGNDSLLLNLWTFGREGTINGGQGNNTLQFPRPGSVQGHYQLNGFRMA